MIFQHWKKYESPERWASYFTQIDEVLAFEPTSCLEIGVGNGIVGAVLGQQGVIVTTLDIDSALQPTMVGSVERIDLPDASVDVVLCAEVLEHLPFEKFGSCIAEISRVARRGAVLSLPHWGYTIRGIIDIPGLPSLRYAGKLPVSTVHSTSGEHCWEIGKKGFPIGRIIKELAPYFIVEREWILSWMPYHHFFRLQKTHTAAADEARRGEWEH